MLADLFARKRIEDLQVELGDKRKEMKRTLGALNLTLIGIGGIIGAGIFVLTGQAAAQYAGPAILLSFLIAGMGCTFTALCYAEFSSLIPVAGSAYTYAYATLGEIFAWIIGWDLVLEYLFGASTVAVGWSGYMISFLAEFGIIIPPEISGAPFHYGVEGLTRTASYFNLFAALIVGFVTMLLVLGIKLSALFNNFIVAIKLLVIAGFVIFGLSYLSTDNLTPFIPPNTGVFGQFGWSGVLRGAGVIFFAYIGFDAISTAAQETKDPQRNLPIGILASLALSTLCFVVVAFVLTGMVHYSKLNVPDPLAVAVDAVNANPLLRHLLKLGIIMGLSAVILVLLLAQPRILYSMSRDGLLPKKLSEIHPRFRTPYISSILTGVLAMLIAGAFPIGLLGELVSIGTLLAFVIVCCGIIVLRYTQPTLPRPFKTPFFPVVPILGALISLAQMLGLPRDTWLRLLVWLILGLLIYFFYSRRGRQGRLPNAA